MFISASAYHLQIGRGPLINPRNPGLNAAKPSISLRNPAFATAINERFAQNAAFSTTILALPRALEPILVAKTAASAGLPGDPPVKAARKGARMAEIDGL